MENTWNFISIYWMNTWIFHLFWWLNIPCTLEYLLCALWFFFHYVLCIYDEMWYLRFLLFHGGTFLVDTHLTFYLLLLFSWVFLYRCWLDLSLWLLLSLIVEIKKGILLGLALCTSFVEAGLSQVYESYANMIIKWETFNIFFFSFMVYYRVLNVVPHSIQ